MTEETNAAPGDEFIRQLTEHQAALHGYVLSALGDPHEAKDALQRTNVVLWKKAAKWDPNSRFLSWAFAVARFEVLAHIRDRQRDRHIFDTNVAEMMAETGETSLLNQTERYDALQSCLGKLRDTDRSLLSAHYVVGKTLREISEEAGRKAGAVRIQIMRLRRALAECIGHRIGTEGNQ